MQKILDGKIICPKHSWHFDLENKGICKESGVSLDVIKLDCSEQLILLKNNPTLSECFSGLKLVFA